ncbi:MAG: HEAT repeat domain-containing protein, partial [Planctomycetes bacterium]|nr:HEAT repeat domain-containing protein [Planctomycetota bacterium]
MTRGEQIKTTKTLVLATVLFLTPPGCTTVRAPASTDQTQQLRQRAMRCLKAGIRYPHNAVVRAEAVEAMESGDRKQTLPWIRTALLDEHPAVRFAACIAIGNATDGVADAAIAKRLSDEHASVRVAAL